MVVTLILVGLVAPVFGQSNDPLRGLEVKPEVPPQNAREARSRPKIELQTPALPEGVELPDIPSTYKQSITLPTILITEIRLEGSTVLDEGVVDTITQEYIGQQVSFEDLQAVRLKLTQAYIKAGYVNSGVLIPDQEVQNGVARFEAHEGTLGKIELQGNHALRTDYIERRVRVDLGSVFNVYELEDSLALMQLRPTIAQVNAQVLAGENRGDSILDLRIRETKPMTLSAGVNNHRAPSVGEDQYLLAFLHQSLTGNGDYLTVNFGESDGFDNVYVDYALPLTSKDLTIEGWYSKGQSDIVEEPFRELDIITDTKTLGAKLLRPIVRTRQHNVALGLIVENKQNESFLLGERFSFSPGDQFGESEVTAARLRADWIWRREQDALSLSAIYSHGVDWFDATDNSTFIDGSLPDSDFDAILVQAHYARRLSFWSTQLVGRLSGQFTGDPLLAVEKFAVGGARTVRGYRENQLVRDKGVIASLELRMPLFPNDGGASRIGLQFVPFFDFGKAKDNRISLPGLDNPRSQELMSVGAGLVWNYWSPLYAEVYYGDALEDLPGGGNNNDDSLQADGVHFLVSLQWNI